jgi:hypothetical protein
MAVHRVVVGEGDPGADEDVLLDHRAAGQVAARLDAGPGADLDPGVDRGEAADRRPGPDLGPIADLRVVADAGAVADLHPGVDDRVAADQHDRADPHPGAQEQSGRALGRRQRGAGHRVTSISPRGT